MIEGKKTTFFACICERFAPKYVETEKRKGGRRELGTIEENNVQCLAQNFRMFINHGCLHYQKSIKNNCYVSFFFFLNAHIFILLFSAEKKPCSPHRFLKVCTHLTFCNSFNNYITSTKIKLVWTFFLLQKKKYYFFNIHNLRRIIQKERVSKSSLKYKKA
ncbi:hypothetical protein RFI_05836 [Reticulomyxa filosa]|uniref:Uncharacterized protein n=1 Tax=Reticulomyxa filosa TaxID=46433 RepID=X6NY87_RETFI|nr:hypothetical protein RFI_05836 [Reticulomyxa filosa]|eukprot:ETO31285.1 hypothetical protein RFI_05836 [Reticulomyxa filosa]